MTPQRAKELLPVIQAFAEGKAVQYQSNLNGMWKDGENINFDLAQEFRIKPSPREWWIETMPNGYFIRWMNGPLPKSEPQNKIIHVREVIDE